jgi:hypothetical protein
VEQATLVGKHVGIWMTIALIDIATDFSLQQLVGLLGRFALPD